MLNLHKRLISLLLVGIFTPAVSFAATSNIGFDGLNNLILTFANGVVRSTGYMMFTLATVVFFFGIVQFIWTARQGSEGKGIQKGTQFIKWGLIAIFIMFSLWGIITFAQGVFGIQGQDTITVPSLNFRPAGGGATGTTGSPGTVTSASCAGYVSNGKCYSDACPNGCTVSTGGTSGGSSGGTSGGTSGGGSGGSGSGGAAGGNQTAIDYTPHVPNGGACAIDPTDGLDNCDDNNADCVNGTCVVDYYSDPGSNVDYTPHVPTGGACQIDPADGLDNCEVDTDECVGGICQDTSSSDPYSSPASGGTSGDVCTDTDADGNPLMGIYDASGNCVIN